LPPLQQVSLLVNILAVALSAVLLREAIVDYLYIRQAHVNAGRQIVAIHSVYENLGLFGANILLAIPTIFILMSGGPGVLPWGPLSRVAVSVVLLLVAINNLQVRRKLWALRGLRRH
jgi:hypothetical protein